MINPINTQLKDRSITECLRGKRLHSICAYDGRVLHEREEDFYILEIPADHISKLSDGFERFFADDPMDDGYIIEETKEAPVHMPTWYVAVLTFIFLKYYKLNLQFSFIS